MTRWMAVPGFLGYSVSDEGRVRNDDNGRLLTVLRNGDGVCYVGMMHSGVQRRRSLGLLVAERFVEKPFPDRNDFDGIIHLNGDQTDNRPENLMWRPHWFAVKYRFQMVHGPKYDAVGPIMDLDTEAIYETPFEACKVFGLCERDLVLAMVNRSSVWPTYQSFRPTGGS